MRWRRAKGGGERTRVVFATDLHGSETCFRKWLNSARVLEADCLVLGGDLTGKRLVPLAETAEGWRGRLAGEEVVARDDMAGPTLLGVAGVLEVVAERIRAGGGYDLLLDAGEQERFESDLALRERLFDKRIREVLESWLELAEERLPATGTPAFFMLGNDDDEGLVEGLNGSGALRYVEDRVCRLPSGHEMISFGYSTPTPWNTPREMEEDELGEAIERLVSQLEEPRRAVFNLHCPPRDTHLDQAPLLDDQLRPKLGAAGTLTGSVGSQAVRDAIERAGPLLGLHGHVHECPAAERLGGRPAGTASARARFGCFRAGRSSIPR